MPYRELAVAAPCYLCEDAPADAACEACGRPTCARHRRVTLCPRCDEAVFRELAEDPGGIGALFLGVPILLAGAFLWAPLIALGLAWIVLALPVSRRITRRRRRARIFARIRASGAAPPLPPEDPNDARQRALDEYERKRRNQKD